MVLPNGCFNTIKPLCCQSLEIRAEKGITETVFDHAQSRMTFTCLVGVGSGHTPGYGIINASGEAKASWLHNRRACDVGPTMKRFMALGVHPILGRRWHDHVGH